MSRKKRSSPIFEKADYRLQNIKSLNPTLDLGSGLSVMGFETDLDAGQTRLDEYNQLLALLDQKLVQVKEAEKHMAALSERILAGIAGRYGKDSAEYAQAGGIRKSDYKRSPRKTTTKTHNPSPAI